MVEVPADGSRLSVPSNSADAEWFRCHSVPQPALYRSVQFVCGTMSPVTPRKFLRDDQVVDAFRSGNYRICNHVFNEILSVAESQHFRPEIDAFASYAHRRLWRYWSAHSDAFNKCWSDKVLWIHPPFKALSRVVEKIFRDEARGFFWFLCGLNAPGFRHYLPFPSIGGIFLPIVFYLKIPVVFLFPLVLLKFFELSFSMRFRPSMPFLADLRLEMVVHPPSSPYWVLS